MSINEEFDELARRKLGERDFPFQENDWQNARRRIDAQRTGRGRAAIWITGALCLLGTALWFAMGHHAAPTGAHEPSAPQAYAPLEPDQHTTAVVEPASLKAETTEAQPALPGSVKESPSGNGKQMKASPSPKHLKKASVEILGQQGAGTKSKISAGQPDHQSVKPLEAAVHEATKEATERHRPDMPTRSSSIAVPKEPNDPVNSVRPSDGRSGTAKDDQERPLHQEDLGSPTIPTLGAAATAEVHSVKPPAAPVPNKPEPGKPNEPVAEDPAPAATDSSKAIQDPHVPGDSTTSAAPAHAAPPIVPERAPWEISVLGGMFTTASRYTGGNSAEWANGVGSANSAGFGVELMHLGRHIGLGFGLHYGNYAEQTRAEAIDRNITSLSHYWYLAAVDTTLLVITDTLPGTPPGYTGNPVDTTVYLLAQGTDTSVTRQHMRDARNELNRVSYLEVPLLIDAHAVQGRWSFGLRGGPTLGLLTGRRGSLPNEAGDGYVGFNDVPFREVVFGYTARAYVRYRFNAAWSVGVEPALRGQLLNSLNDGQLQRRSAAQGVMLSLTYRLR
ncbi:MAG: hypothetical protein JST45_02025 [Bacteroidetes bacterium]|nr:hypothetical protein [Bacteroidota bacterium]